MSVGDNISASTIWPQIRRGESSSVTFSVVEIVRLHMLWCMVNAKKADNTNLEAYKVLNNTFQTAIIQNISKK
jgi:hypothetical protein